MSRFALLLGLAFSCFAQTGPPGGWGDTEHDYTVPDFEFKTGEKLPALRLHYTTLGAPTRDAAGRVNNAVLIMHGTGGNGRAFLSAQFAGVLFGKGQPLDSSRYFIILPDAIGHGKSNKPSDGLHQKFPKYDYDDMVRADYLLIHDGLHVDHLRLVMGTSMGAMHSWVWGEMYPDFMDALMPLASAPIQIAGRNRIFRDMVIDSIRSDPDFHDGEYTHPIRGLYAAEYALYMMTSSPLQQQKSAPTRDAADAAFQAIKARADKLDANDMVYQYESSRNYNPEPGLGKIEAPLYAINSADDEVNPPELGILEREIKKVRRGRYILIPTSDETRGHGTHSRPAVWQQYLLELLKESEPHTASVPDVYSVTIATTKGAFTLEIHRDWAPRGADRFYELVRAHYFDDSRFFRVVPNYIAQFGIAGNPAVASAWREKTIPDDPVRESNARGTIAYAMTGPGARSTELYINLADNRRLDAQGFAPIGLVSAGMDVVDSLYSGYGEASGGGMRAGHQSPLFESGNAWLDEHFPKLDKLLSATVL
jgi:homoserine O-acetyltransferase/O-succinyltransferase